MSYNSFLHPSTPLSDANFHNQISLTLRSTHWFGESSLLSVGNAVLYLLLQAHNKTAPIEAAIPVQIGSKRLAQCIGMVIINT